MKLIILDRDGVINKDRDDYVKSPEEWIALPGSLEAIAKLNQAGFQIVVATNQSGVGRRLFDLATLEAIHHKMQSQLAEVGGHIDRIYFCLHTSEDHCDCRKPKSGLFKQIAMDFGADLSQAYAVGDSFRDIQAASAVGCQTFLVKTGNGERTLAAHASELQNTSILNNLSEVVAQLIMDK